MTSCVRKAIVLVIAVLVCTAIPLQADSGLSADTPDKPIDIRLHNASMADAVGAIAKLGGVEIIAPVGPSEGISLSLTQSPVPTVLDLLAKAVGMEWEDIEGVITFRKPDEPAATEPTKTAPDLTPEQSMSLLLGSLDSSQMFRLSLGFSLAYGDLAADQQEVVKDLLSSSVGFNAAGEVVRDLPAPEQTSISFATIPYLVIPAMDDKKADEIRLDSREYTTLRKGAAK